MIQYNGVYLHQLPIWLEMMLGVALGIFIYFHNSLMFESNNKFLFVVFLVGFLYPVAKPIDISLGNGIIIITAFISYFTIMYYGHINFYKEIEDSKKKQHIFKTITQKKGYIEDKSFSDNASADRFGIIVIGRKGHRGFWNTILRKAGWKEDELMTLYKHERGHNLIGIFMLMLEILIYYFFFSNLILHFGIASLLLYPFLFTTLTLSSWLDELLADTVAGPISYTLMEYIHAVYKIHLGSSFGVSSHPSETLRRFAYNRAFIVVLFITEIVIFFNFYLHNFR